MEVVGFGPLTPYHLSTRTLKSVPDVEGATALPAPSVQPINNEACLFNSNEQSELSVIYNEVAERMPEVRCCSLTGFRLNCKQHVTPGGKARDFYPSFCLCWTVVL